MGHLAATSSGKLLESATITSSAALLYGAKLIGGTDNSRLKIYNNTSAAGTIVWELANAGGTNAGDVNDSVTFKKPIVCSSGIHAVLAGTDAEFEVSYRNQ